MKRVKFESFMDYHVDVTFKDGSQERGFIDKLDASGVGGKIYVLVTITGRLLVESFSLNQVKKVSFVPENAYFHKSRLSSGSSNVFIDPNKYAFKAIMEDGKEDQKNFADTYSLLQLKQNTKLIKFFFGGEELKMINDDVDKMASALDFSEFFTRDKQEQQKKDKLLELYRKYFELNDVQIVGDGHSYGNSKNTKESILVIKEIQELEEELK